MDRTSSGGDSRAGEPASRLERDAVEPRRMSRMSVSLVLSALGLLMPLVVLGLLIVDGAGSVKVALMAAGYVIAGGVGVYAALRRQRQLDAERGDGPGTVRRGPASGEMT
ncbi:hypothetical protein [Janibacter melonis]|uniref:hypothetical protein n=1 Tax=Janibacter melonis TaxID=262209 RepID=UPI001919B401|nr:hypothetical protein [Janibacter melonis]